MKKTVLLVDDARARAPVAASGRALAELLGAELESGLSEAADAEHVVALVLPLEATALQLATALAKPVLVVPPDAAVTRAFRRVLVPLEGTRSTSLAPRSIVELAGKIDVVALHVHEEDSIPAFTDQPQHEHAAWEQEFLARWCPWGIGSVQLESRVGRAADVVPVAAHECGCDLIALGWSRELEAGRAPVVRAALERSRVPVLLVPATVTDASRAA
jgi:hypothetical protein